MFDTDPERDGNASRMTRRVFAGGAIAGVLSFIGLRILHGPGVEASTEVHGTPGEVTIVNFSDEGTNLGPQTVARVVKTDGAWFRQLGKNSYEIAREADTEMAFSGVTWQEHRGGIYRCLCCETALFSSQTKFDSGTGWPSFWAPLAKENVVSQSDSSLGMARTEVKCARCEAHLGHVFNDGPHPTGLRYCMNSASLHFRTA